MTTLKTVLGLAAAAAALGVAHSAQAQASVTFSTAATVNANDQSNLVGTTTAAGNVNGGTSYDTYIANDQPAVGQFFTTGSNAAGYEFTAITLQQVTYNTYFDTATNTTTNSNPFTVQVLGNFATPPSITATAVDYPGTVLLSETANVTGAEPNNFGTGAGVNGTGHFITFTFAAPVTLAANTEYGFDVGSANDFFQSNGTNTAAYAGGQAFITGSGGKAGADGYTVGGDHVFVASLTALAPVPEASTTVSLGLLLTLGLGGLVLARRKSVNA